jgi:hypothetical protein
MSSNHGQVGKVLHITFKPDTEDFKKFGFQDGQVFTAEEFNAGGYGAQVGVPIHFLSSTVGDYDVVCEYGTEVHFFDEDEEEALDEY